MHGSITLDLEVIVIGSKVLMVLELKVGDGGDRVGVDAQFWTTMEISYWAVLCFDNYCIQADDASCLRLCIHYLSVYLCHISFILLINN